MKPTIKAKIGPSSSSRSKFAGIEIKTKSNKATPLPGSASKAPSASGSKKASLPKAAKFAKPTKEAKVAEGSDEEGSDKADDAGMEDDENKHDDQSKVSCFCLHDRQLGMDLIDSPMKMISKIRKPRLRQMKRGVSRTRETR